MCNFLLNFICLLKATVEALSKGQSLFVEDEGRGAVKGDMVSFLQKTTVEVLCY
jgi:hypothetical protein